MKLHQIIWNCVKKMLDLETPSVNIREKTKNRAANWERLVKILISEVQVGISDVLIDGKAANPANFHSLKHIVMRKKKKKEGFANNI